MARTKSPENILTDLRSRHIHCISWNEVNRDLRSGAMSPEYFEKFRRFIGPSCEYPEDITCAAPGISTESITQAIREHLEQHEE